MVFWLFFCPVLFLHCFEEMQSQNLLRVHVTAALQHENFLNNFIYRGLELDTEEQKLHKSHHFRSDVVLAPR
jgi:hypothetical protein